jgi:hypothetical protein
MSGWGSLGEVLGGGIDTAGAYEQGRLRTAQTESALGLARERQLENMAREAKAKAIERAREQEARLGVGSTDMSLVDLAEAGFGNWDQVSQGRGNLQIQGFRDTLADKDAALGDQFAAGQGVQGRVLPRMEVTGGVYENLMDPEAGLRPTPTGAADIALAEARANDPDLRQWGSPSSTGPGPNGEKIPLGYDLNPNYDPTKPPGEGNYKFIDSRQPAQGTLGSIERRFITRVTGAAAQTLGDVEAFLSLPANISVGRFGGSAGMKNEHNMMDALMYQAKYQMTPEEANMYNAALGGFGEQMRILEAQGMRGAASTASQFDALRFEAKDSQFTRLWKMARVRQTLENALEPNLANSALPEQEKAFIRDIITKSRQMIPFTVKDVAEYRREQLRDPNATLGEMLESNVQKGLGGAQPATATPGAAPAPTVMDFATEAEAEAAEAAGRLKKGTRITIGGVPGTWQ